MDNVLAEKWYIPVKQDEAFGLCLIAAINLAQENKLDTVVECKQFIENIVPEAFQKVNILAKKKTFSSLFILVTKYFIS